MSKLIIKQSSTFLWQKTYVSINVRSPKITAFSNFQQVILGKIKEKTLQKPHLIEKDKASS